MWHKIFHPLGFLILAVFMAVPSLQAGINYSDFTQWHEIKSAHFIVLHYNKEDEFLAQNVSRKAEEYYDKVARQLGYSRYGDFWTWEERVKIFIFPDRLSFSMTTGQPMWSKGYATRDTKLFESRAIVSYKQEEGFTENLLPHEIGHLIMKDLIGFNRLLPLWFEEGVAQLQEQPNDMMYDGIVMLVKGGQFIPFDMFGDMDIRFEKNELKVSIFYAQAWSVVDFLIKVYGQDSFQRLCRNLRDGMGFNDALKNAYAPSIDSTATLGQKWVQYMQEK